MGILLSSQILSSSKQPDHNATCESGVSPGDALKGTVPS